MTWKSSFPMVFFFVRREQFVDKSIFRISNANFSDIDLPKYNPHKSFDRKQIFAYLYCGVFYYKNSRNWFSKKNKQTNIIPSSLDGFTDQKLDQEAQLRTNYRNF